MGLKKTGGLLPGLIFIYRERDVQLDYSVHCTLYSVHCTGGLLPGLIFIYRERDVQVDYSVQ